MHCRGVDQMVDRVLWEHEAAGSSPVTPTIIYRSRRSGGETGIHTGLKIPRRKTYGFDSRPEHQCGCGEMADTSDLGSDAERCAGSNPVTRTKHFKNAGTDA